MNYALKPHHATSAAGLVSAVVLSSVGGGLLAASLSYRTLFALAYVAGLLILLGAYLSGNPRLVLLLGLAIVLPLDLSKRFMTQAHFGGEIAVRIEAADLFVAGLLLIWFADVFRGRVRTLQVPSVLIVWGLFITLSVALLPLWLYRTLAAYEIIRMIKLFGLALVMVNMIRSKNLLVWFVMALFAGALLQSVYGLAQQFLNFQLPLEAFGQLKQGVTERLGIFTASRVGGMLGHPNFMGAYLIMILAIAFAVLYGDADYPQKVAASVTMVFGLPALVLTLSRAAWLGFALGAFVITATSLAHPRLRYKQLTLRILTIAGMAGMGLVLSGRIIEKFTMSASSSVEARVIWMKIAWDMIKANPIFGVGLNAFTYFFDEFDETVIPWGEMPPPVHNIYLLTWAEEGTVGFIGFLLVLAAIIYLGLKNMRTTDSHLLTLNMGVLGGTMALMVQGLADFTFRGNPVMRTFIALVALLAVVNYLIEAEEEQPESNPAKGPPGKRRTAPNGPAHAGVPE